MKGWFLVRMATFSRILFALVVLKALKNSSGAAVFGFYILVTASKQALCAS
jgi:hypothetical protein